MMNNWFSEKLMKTILLIEDNFYHARLVRRILEPHNYRFLHASDGESGLQMAIEEKPDLILVDMGLPDLDGQTVVALLKHAPDLTLTPLIAVTAWPADTGEQMVKAYGCDGYISKPIRPREFPSQIADYLD
jgi:two-component system cell cycle response regulator DivK